MGWSVFRQPGSTSRSRAGGRYAMVRHAVVAATLACLPTLQAAQRPQSPQAGSNAESAAADWQSAAVPGPVAAEQMAEQALQASESAAPPPAGQAAAIAETKQLDWLNLLLYQGGILMWPIAATSLLVVTFGLERLIALRRRRVLPRKLLRGLTALAVPGASDPRQLARLAQQFPSSASTVIRAMLLKAGKPASEIEQAIDEASSREASRLYGNVRWLNLAAAVAPLLGLLGTVQGMIQSFFVTANAPLGTNKAQMLAQGIYIALVTTLAGLTVAIPATVLAHYFEGRIQSLFRELTEKLLPLVPLVERAELRRPREQAIDRAPAAAAEASRQGGSGPGRPKK